MKATYKGEAFRAFGSMNPMDDATRNLENESEEWIESCCGYSVDYFHVKGVKKSEPSAFGGEIVTDYGYVGFAQSDTFDNLDDAKKFISWKRLVSNRCYCGFGIHHTFYDRTTKKLTIEVISLCEPVNVTGVIDSFD